MCNIDLKKTTYRIPITLNIEELLEEVKETLILMFYKKQEYFDKLG